MRVFRCRVIAIAGSDEKCDFLRSIGAAHTINYKRAAMAEALPAAVAAVGGTGVDVYFDNVGGPTTDALWPLYNVGARVIICGQISTYNGGLDAPEMVRLFDCLCACPTHIPLDRLINCVYVCIFICMFVCLFDFGRLRAFCITCCTSDCILSAFWRVILSHVTTKWSPWWRRCWCRAR